MPTKVKHLIFLVLLAAFGVWLISRPAALTPETIARQDAVQQALAPGGSAAGSGGPVGIANDDSPDIVRGLPVSPGEVDIMTLPTGPAAEDDLYQRYLNGEIDFEINEGPYSEAVFQALKQESAQQGVDPTVQNYVPDGTESTLTMGTNFKTIDYTQSQQGVPPDPDLMVGTDHIVVGVNTSFQVFNKSGTSVVGPILYETFWGNNCGTGAATMNYFDPFSDYDEAAGRYILGITAYDSAVNGGDNGYACIAVSKTNSAAGEWWLYSFDGNPGGDPDYFFDYPHLGVGQNALYLSANMFSAQYVRSHIFAYQKSAMYNGQSANHVKFNNTTDFTFQPAKLHGFDDGGWPSNASEPHYFVTANWGNGQTILKVWRFSDPWGTASFTLAGSVTVNSYNLPIDQPQSGSADEIQGNDNRLLDVHYRAGRLWTTHTIGCNPGSGTVNCARWYEINIGSGTPVLVQQGTFSSNGDFRSFPDLAVNRCGDMVIGYTKTSSSTFPSVYAAGREASDALGTLKNETLVHAGEAFYTAYDTPPRRWGDYTGMAIDPDGLRFWYVGEYSRNQANARWSTWVAAFTFPACGSAPVPTEKEYLPAIIRQAAVAPPPTPTATSPAPAGLVNGNFEAGPNVGWSEFSTHGWPVVVQASELPGGVTPHSGNWAAWLGGDYDDDSYVQQQVTVPPGSPYLGYWHWIASADVCGWDFAYVRVNGNNASTYTLCDSNSTGGWVKNVVNLGAYAGQNISLQIRVETDSTLNSNLFVDDVAFQASPAAEGDAPTWLPGSAPAAKPEASLQPPFSWLKGAVLPRP